MGEPTPSHIPEMVRADQIKVGDILDLQGDQYADQPTPDHANDFEFEFATVTEVERETADCIRIGGEGFCVGFPVDHMLKRHGHDDRFDLHPIIHARADRLHKAMSAGGYEYVGDLICDILHFCDVERLDFDIMVEDGRYSYKGETGPGDDIEQDNRLTFKKNGNKL